MTARTLEEIEALDAQANASGETTRMRVMEFPRLLAIAQEQRAELDDVFAAIDEVDAAYEDQAFGWSLRKDAARKRLQALRDKHKIGTKR